ncbi:MAG: peptidoglycan bridge formation glycyltransferase FemA/FemB family protein [Candidatus Portnoybacteria bacterium]|nr:peptidoglycan bridge formation glycyltransferase FemA/FemB family protein [Candidatus Portnoybacteria bacterium]
MNDKKIWEGFLAGIEQKTFLHSWVWGEFSKAMGERIWRLGICDNEKLEGVILVVRIEAKRGRFLFVPHGPIFESSKFKVQSSKLQSKVKSLVDCLRNIAKEEHCSFVRISPIWEDTEANREVFRKLGFRSAPMHMHSELTLIMDISKSEEEILQGMRKTTRNLVRRGGKEGVEVVKGSLDEFYPIFAQTAKRQGFVRFSRDYMEEELKAFNTKYKILNTKYNQSAEIFLAKYQGEILAGAFIVFYGDTAYYHHAASVHSKIPAAYTLVWEIIKEVKKRGMEQFNFWGVVPEADTKHPWWGLSLFKRGFGGKEWNLMHAQDLPFSWKYWISWGIEKARKLKRRY